MGSGTDTSIGFIAGGEQDICVLLTPSVQAGVGDGAGEPGGWRKDGDE